MFLNRHKKLFVSFSCLPKLCLPVTTQMTARRVVYVGSLIKLIRSFLFLPWPVACLWLAWHKQQTIQQQSITKRIVNAIAKNSPQSNSIFEKFPWLVSFHVNCSVSEGTTRTSSADEKINLISCFVSASAGGSNEFFLLCKLMFLLKKFLLPLTISRSMLQITESMKRVRRRSITRINLRQKLWFIEKIKFQINSWRRFILELKPKPGRMELEASENIFPEFDSANSSERNIKNPSAFIEHKRNKVSLPARATKGMFSRLGIDFSAHRVIKTNILCLAN